MKGSHLNNAARSFGKAFDPTGGGLRGMLNTGAAIMTNGTTLPLSAAGFGSRHLSDAGTRRAAEQIALKIRAQGIDIPESKLHEMLKDPQQADAIARALGLSAGPVQQ